MADSDKPAREEEFYYLLTEGSELLQAGKVDDARVIFERALEMNPTHEQALNLLGLSLFRLNQLDRARKIFADLVYNNPIEPSLRLNLAMVHLKTSHLEDAKLELERVLELSPDHPRATSYMGLVLERKGDLERAATFYERAGNHKRADEIRAYRPTATGTFPLPNLQAMIAQTQAAQAQAQVPVPTPSPALPPTPVVPPIPVERAVSSSSAQQSEAAALTAATAAQLKRVTEPPAAAAVESARGSSLGFTLEVAQPGRASMTPTLTPASVPAPVANGANGANGSTTPAPVTVLPAPAPAPRRERERAREREPPRRARPHPAHRAGRDRRCPRHA